MLLFQTIKKIFSNHFQCTFPLRSTFFECSFLLKEHYSIKLLAWAPRVTNQVIYWQLVSVFNFIFPGSYNYSDVPQQLHIWCMMNFSFWFSQGVSVIQMCLRIQMNPGLSGFCMWKRHPKEKKSKRLKNNSKHFQRTFPLISTFFECSFLLKEHYRFTFFECSFSKLLSKYF